MKVIGITSGIGSLQYGFKQQGFEIGPSHEWRKYYNIAGTFKRNYDQGVTEWYDGVLDTKWMNPACIVSHPECGNYSNLYTGKNREHREADPGDIYKFIDLCKKYKPMTFLCDNLPKSLLSDRIRSAVKKLYSKWGYRRN